MRSGIGQGAEEGRDGDEKDRLRIGREGIDRKEGGGVVVANAPGRSGGACRPSAARPSEGGGLMLRFLAGFIKGLILALAAAALVSLFLPLPPVAVREEAPAALEAPPRDGRPALPAPPDHAAGNGTLPAVAPPPPPALTPPASDGARLPGADTPLAPPKPAAPPPPPGAAGQGPQARQGSVPPRDSLTGGGMEDREATGPAPLAAPRPPGAPSGQVVGSPPRARQGGESVSAPASRPAPAPQPVAPPPPPAAAAGKADETRAASAPQAAPSPSAMVPSPPAPSAPTGEEARPAAETESAPPPAAKLPSKPSAAVAAGEKDMPAPAGLVRAGEAVPAAGSSAPGPQAVPEEAPPVADMPLPPPVAPEELPAFIRFALPTSPAPAAPRMAILIIDLGPEGVPAEVMAKLPAGVSFVVDPRRGKAGERAAFYRTAGHEVAVLVPTVFAPSAFAEEIADWPVVALVDLAPPDPARSDRIGQLATRLGLGLVLGPEADPAAVRPFRDRGVPAGRIFQILDDEGESALAMRRILNRSALKARKEGGVILAAHSLAPSVAAIRRWMDTLPARQVTLAPLTSALLDTGDGQ